MKAAAIVTAITLAIVCVNEVKAARIVSVITLAIVCVNESSSDSISHHFSHCLCE
jgi:hypothetical protein